MTTSTRSRIKIAGWVGTGLISGVLLSVGLSALAQRETRLSLPIDELRQFAEVYGAVKSNYVESVEDKKLITEAISGMLTGLDPHSAYLDAEAFKELQVGTQGEFGGLGIEVGVEDGFVRVVSPIEDTPADRAGVMAGDLIVKINDKETKGMSLQDAVKLMRGKPKTSIELTISRKGMSQPLVLTIVREVIRVQSVKSNWVEPGYAFIRITQFQEHTVETMVTHLNKLLATSQSNPSQPVKGIVLDLRNDPGGLLHAAVGVSAAFLPGDMVVVTTDGRLSDAKRSFRSRAEDYQRGGKDPLAGLDPRAKTLPMTILVNAGSASASEIVAGALQDHGSAKVIGTQSFGKGSVQTILPLTSNTAIKLTTARYLTPKGRIIQAKGIRPDFCVEETAEGDISDRFRLREADLNRHLDNAQGTEQSAGPQTRTQGKEPPADRKPLVFGSPEDHQLKQAVALLQGQPVVTNPAPPEPK